MTIDFDGPWFVDLYQHPDGRRGFIPCLHRDHRFYEMAATKDTFFRTAEECQHFISTVIRP